MSASGSRGWLGIAAIVGVLYLGIGLGFAAIPAATAGERITWRWAAWIVSGVLFAAHIGYEQLRLGSRVRTTALHAALAAAMGSFWLAVAAFVHALTSGSGRLVLHAIALVAWPAITAIPAFLVALVAAAVLARVARPAPEPGSARPSGRAPGS